MSRYQSDAIVSGYYKYIVNKNGCYQESYIVRVEEHVVKGWHDDQYVPPSPPWWGISDQKLETRSYSDMISK